MFGRGDNELESIQTLLPINIAKGQHSRVHANQRWKRIRSVRLANPLDGKKSEPLFGRRVSWQQNFMDLKAGSFKSHFQLHSDENLLCFLLDCG